MVNRVTYSKREIRKHLINPTPSPHFYAEPLSMVVPKMRSDSKEDLDDMVIARFLGLGVRQLQLQSQHLSDLLHDEEAEEEPSSLSHKPSRQKHSLSQSKRNTSTSVESPTKSADAVSSEKFMEKYGDKTVKENGGKSDGEELENSGENVHEKSVEKGKSIRKSMKRKWMMMRNPIPPRNQKLKCLSSGKEKLRNQKVLWGRTFIPDIVELAGMRQLVEICDFQQWTHLFTNDVPKVYEEEVRSFYANLFTVEDDHICVLGACSSNFRNDAVKDKAIQQGERVHKKTLLPVYHMLFEMVNKVLLPRAERRSITSKVDLVLMKALDGFTTINLPGIMIEHMQKVADFKDGNHGLPYGFLLTKVFEFFKVPLGQAKVGTKKQTFSKTTLEECECIDKDGGVGSTCTISQLINAQNSATEEIQKLKARNAILESQLSQLQEVPGSGSSPNSEVARLTQENAELRKRVEDLK
uniref:Putative plant transposon protein domain-containing protein n=1 Tax=Nicotiana tabacum TaxID=4097 RepID=A0A1S4C293_TOBAC|nr:PREDICTED: uncharacterized protein LOC107814294 [Nicotiana tabacum]